MEQYLSEGCPPYDYDEALDYTTKALRVTVDPETEEIRVFRAETDDKKEGLRQIISFFSGRLFSLGCEEAFLAVFITWLGFSELWVKLAAQIVVVILNYIISKLIVFRKKKTE